MTLDFYSLEGQKVKTLELADAVFAAPIVESVIHQALLRQLANMRQCTAKVKGRSERAGGGRKPWRQKGTGRARQGSIRAAQWIKGGRIFGPTPDRNYTLDMPRKQRRLALLGVLTQKAQSTQLLGLSVSADIAPKTKTASAFLEKMNVERNVLFLYDAAHEGVNKSFRNLASVKMLDVQQLNVADLLKYRQVLMTEDALNKIHATWAK